MAKGQKVFIADHIPDLLNLFDMLLRDEGCETATGAMDTPVMDEVKRFAPDAILVNLIRGHDEDLNLLDQLRTDPATRATPVVAMSTMPDALAQAVASYNVRQVLLKPFNVEDLVEKVSAASAPLLRDRPSLPCSRLPCHQSIRSSPKWLGVSPSRRGRL